MEIREYINPLLKWWWLILLSTAVAAGSSFLATRQQQLMYRSSATLVIGNAFENPNPSSNDLYLSQRLAATYVDLANRSSVRESTMEALGIDWLPQIFVRQNNDTNIIEITVTDTDPARAQAVADELSRQLILRSPTAQQEDKERQAFIDEQLDDYETAIRETQQQLGEKNEQIGDLTSAVEIATLQEEIATLESNLQALRSNWAILLQSTEQGATNTVRILEEATLPRSPVDPNTTITILTAAGIGFVLGAAAAYLLEYLDDTIRTPAHITKATSLTTLAGIADVRGNKSKLVTVTQPRSPTAEAFRILRTGIQYASVDQDHRTLLLSSSTPGEGKSMVTSNLAVVMAQAGYNVLLIDADLRRPSQHLVFDLPNRRGLTNLLLELDAATDAEAQKLLVQDIVQSTPVEGLFLLTSGRIPPNPSELLGSTKMTQLLDALLEEFDYLILDSPPVLSVTDAVVLSVHTDLTILIVHAGKSRKGSLKQTVESLREVNANLGGAILNGLTPSSEGYGKYYYYRDTYYTQDTPDAGSADGGKPRSKLRKRLLGGDENVVPDA